MKKFKFLVLIFYITAVHHASAQQVLPGITVKDFSGKIVVSWRNEYSVPVTTINIQRSFDSVKNYTTIGSVLNPQNLENGYADDKPPYTKMYYRLFISFEGGSYLFSSIVRPVRIIPVKDTATAINEVTKYPWQANPVIATLTDSIVAGVKEPTLPGVKVKVDPLEDPNLRVPPRRDSIIVKNIPEIIIYPSLRIFGSKDNNIVIHLPDAAIKKYTVKFYDEDDVFLFELSKLKEEYLIVEKVNFVHAGWFHFELFENGKLLEKNKFFIGKDTKLNGDNSRKTGTNK
ncbi:hypothetical protein BH11BAC4_BH11BAC4_11220 [soil metagenome]